MNLAQRLLKAGVLTIEELAPALNRQKKFRGFLAKHLLELKLLEPKVLEDFIYDYPRVPQTLEETGLTHNLLIQLILKHAYFRDTFSIREMTGDIRIGAHLVEPLLNNLKQQNLIFARPRDILSNRNRMSMEMYYALTEQGKSLAEQALESNRYVGPAPVPLDDYWDWVEFQTIHQVKVQMARLKEVFADFEMNPGLLEKIGPAVNSGRSIFLFGPSGNGKTMMSTAIGHAFEDTIFVPFAIYVYGQIIRLFDEVNHEPVSTNGDLGHDPRWVLCRRPVVITGGELTEDSLELRFNPLLKYYEPPHQLRANNGVFIIDDFGRQKMSPTQLLNRWMYPLESRQDFCCLHTGQQFGVPFDQLIIFSTNLNPHSLTDEAFLRRIRHKIFIGYVTPTQYLSIFRKVCQEYDMEFDEALVRDILDRYYVSSSRPLTACHPRDLIENLVDRARFLGQKPRLTGEDLDSVCQSYFLRQADITNYDNLGNPGDPSPLQ